MSNTDNEEFNTYDLQFKLDSIEGYNHSLETGFNLGSVNISNKKLYFTCDKFIDVNGELFKFCVLPEDGGTVHIPDGGIYINNNPITDENNIVFQNYTMNNIYKILINFYNLCIIFIEHGEIHSHTLNNLAENLLQNNKYKKCIQDNQELEEVEFNDNCFQIIISDQTNNHQTNNHQTNNHQTNNDQTNNDQTNNQTFYNYMSNRVNADLFSKISQSQDTSSSQVSQVNPIVQNAGSKKKTSKKKTSKKKTSKKKTSKKKTSKKKTSKRKTSKKKTS